MNKIPPFFIVSSGRTGTTLLTAMLNVSESVFVPPESDFIARAYPTFQKKKSYSVEDYRILVRLFKLTSQMKGWGLDEAYLESELLRGTPQSFSDVNRIIYDAYLKHKGLENRSWGVKRPVLIASMDRIRDVFPSARFIHLVRDGRDVYLSYKKVHETGEKWGPNNVVTTALYWVDGVRRVDKEKINTIFEISYEALVKEPADTLRKVCSFLGINYSDDMIKKYGNVARETGLIANKHSHATHKNIFKSIQNDNTNKYINKMSKIQLFMFELIAAPYLVQYGYPLTFRFLDSVLLNIVREPLFIMARKYNDWRYSRRDMKRIQMAER